ncbi:MULTISPECIES: MarR family transcriptional regulator [Alteromonadaceae]|jgi:DNA-binding MarR family transcriptional regulator|uniref:MarR family transcriptional regulator n=1 Tax=Brumicola blandensis TaxID=3075611 RepID=A0AAW8R3X3_9ALTE|nr:MULTISPECIES: MarR family transcriptional regulator [unclassified Alteromonas]MDT0584118.1 MarR family transcriptional regulator [Alteromonas sp. W409]MDT0629031.1 MarR family transcriptional regulator [Alteromonas sp. W364]
MEKTEKRVSLLLSINAANSLLTKKLDGTLGAIHGIGLTEYMVLNELNNAHEYTVRRIDLADSLGKSASGITRILLPMEKSGLIVKQSNLKDARVSLVKITDAGMEIFNNAHLTVSQKCEQIFAHWNESETVSVLKLLSMLSLR